ncbi:MAG: prepilin-type N-terminal cleavage/methylation domain-containing protein [Candidatus Peribacteria bacterium]|nr:prepilin-type N-terminal cleavage/methylation domain-containing protein [Candidatus Peribacteria bacterium]
MKQKKQAFSLIEIMSALLIVSIVLLI